MFAAIILGFGFCVGAHAGTDFRVIQSHSGDIDPRGVLHFKEVVVNVDGTSVEDRNEKYFVGCKDGCIVGMNIGYNRGIEKDGKENSERFGSSFTWNTQLDSMTFESNYGLWEPRFSGFSSESHSTVPIVFDKEYVFELKFNEPLFKLKLEEKKALVRFKLKFTHE